MPKDEENLNRVERFKLLTETSSDTLMGRLLRSFWQPVANSRKIAVGTTSAVRVMGEDLTLYRGQSGKPYLIAGRCAHRCTVLHTGHVEGEQLRCMYHGWRYDGAGHCTHRPAEKRETESIKIAAYPVKEYAGLIFGFLGQGMPPPFDLPRKEILEDASRNNFVHEEMYDCNWFQQIENSLDAIHVSFVHIWGKMSRFGEELTTAVPELSFSETSAGMQQVATRSESNVRVTDWTFPNNNHIVVPGPKKGDPWNHLCVWAVPIDDHSTMRFTVINSEGSDRRLQSDIKPDYQPAQHYEELFFRRTTPALGSTQLHSVQDYVAIRGQGVIADRMNERLGQSDQGIVMLRRIFWRELEAFRQGKPLKQWSRLKDPMHLPIPTTESVKAEL